MRALWRTKDILQSSAVQFATGQRSDEGGVLADMYRDTVAQHENQELSRPNSSPITQRLEPLNQVSSETNWKFVEHKTDDSQILDFELVHVRKADIC